MADHPLTRGLDHLGLTVKTLKQTTEFFLNTLGWTVTATDLNYPRSTVTDGNLRLTLRQAQTDAPTPFDRKTNLGLHHLALQVPDKATLDALAERLAQTPEVTIEFPPEPMGQGPRMHMIFTEPGGLRLELLWSGT